MLQPLVQLDCTSGCSIQNDQCYYLVSVLTRLYSLTFLRAEVSTVFTSMRGPISSTVSGSVVGIDGSSSLRRTSSLRRSYTTGAAGLKRKSLCLQIKFQVVCIVYQYQIIMLYLMKLHNKYLLEALRESSKNFDFESEALVNFEITD